MRDLTKEEINTIFAGKCPQCGQREGFYEGGSGGMSLNIFCANKKCEAGFNLMGPDPAINLGGQLINVSKLGDHQHVLQKPKPVEVHRPWWKRLLGRN
jgi:hypothetical protein